MSKTPEDEGPIFTDPNNPDHQRYAQLCIDLLHQVAMTGSLNRLSPEILSSGYLWACCHIMDQFGQRDAMVEMLERTAATLKAGVPTVLPEKGGLN